MKYTLYEVVSAISDIFCNSIGFSAIFFSAFVGIILCKFTKIRIQICCSLGSFLFGIIGFLACISNNNLDFLWIPIFFIPFSTVLLIFSIFYNILIKLFRNLQQNLRRAKKSAKARRKNG